MMGFGKGKWVLKIFKGRLGMGMAEMDYWRIWK